MKVRVKVSVKKCLQFIIDEDDIDRIYSVPLLYH